jgi:hypothetical protein
MTSVLYLFLTFLREAWMALTGAFIAFALLAGMAQILRVSSAGVLGANTWAWKSISALTSIIVLGLFAFLGIPQIVSALQSSLPGAGGCGPIDELGTLASGLIGGLAALRMLKAMFISMFSVSIGGSSTFANALIECAEAIFGMFDSIMEQILVIARDAWAFMAGLLIVVALLGGLYYILQGTAGAAFGASRMTSTAIIGVAGLVIVVLFAFLFLPQIAEMLRSFQPKPPF